MKRSEWTELSLIALVTLLAALGSSLSAEDKNAARFPWTADSALSVAEYFATCKSEARENSGAEIVAAHVAPAFGNAWSGERHRFSGRDDSIAVGIGGYSKTMAWKYAVKVPDSSSLALHGVPKLTTVAGQGAQVFLHTMDYVGTSMQTLNPPRLDTTISFRGLDLRSGNTIGDGLHNLSVWGKDLAVTPMRPVEFNRTTLQPLHSDTSIGNTRTITSGYSWESRITTTPANRMERVMLQRYPVGDYFDPQSSATSIHRQRFQTTIETTYPITVSPDKIVVTKLPSASSFPTYGGNAQGFYNARTVIPNYPTSFQMLSLPTANAGEPWNSIPNVGRWNGAMFDNTKGFSTSVSSFKMPNTVSLPLSSSVGSSVGNSANFSGGYMKSAGSTRSYNMEVPQVKSSKY